MWPPSRLSPTPPRFVRVGCDPGAKQHDALGDVRARQAPASTKEALRTWSLGSRVFRLVRRWSWKCSLRVTERRALRDQYPHRPDDLQRLVSAWNQLTGRNESPAEQFAQASGRPPAEASKIKRAAHSSSAMHLDLARSRVWPRFGEGPRGIGAAVATRPPVTRPRTGQRWP